jgi:hypothetical protein
MKVPTVEDETLVAIRRIGISFGHQVCGVAASACEAIETATMHTLDVALMDKPLPEPGVAVVASGGRPTDGGFGVSPYCSISRLRKV